MNVSNYKVIVLGAFISFGGCSLDSSTLDKLEAEKSSELSSFVSSKLIATIPMSKVKQMLSAQGMNAYRNEIKYGVKVYKLIYTTTYQGKQIRASGLVCLPEGIKSPAPVLSVQHGTIFKAEEAPSYFSNISGYEFFAAAGYITLFPDYIGGGESGDILHPYYDQEHAALAVIDMIKAAKDFCKEQDVKANEQLFLVGYSEGGFATLAAQKEIELNHAHELNVTAAAAGAGGYDLVGLLQENIANNRDSYTMPFLAYMIHAFNTTNNWNRPLSDFFQQPYAERIPELFDGSKDWNAIYKALPKDPKKLLNPTFYQALQDDEKELVLKKVLVDNSPMTDWAPRSHMRLYHGTSDILVPLENSKGTYKKLKGNGAAKVEFFPIEGNHQTAYFPMMQSIIPWIKSF